MSEESKRKNSFVFFSVKLLRELFKRWDYLSLLPSEIRTKGVINGLRKIREQIEKQRNLNGNFVLINKDNGVYAFLNREELGDLIYYNSNNERIVVKSGELLGEFSSEKRGELDKTISDLVSIENEAVTNDGNYLHLKEVDKLAKELISTKKRELETKVEQGVSKEAVITEDGFADFYEYLLTNSSAIIESIGSPESGEVKEELYRVIEKLVKSTKYYSKEKGEWISMDVESEDVRELTDTLWKSREFRERIGRLAREVQHTHNKGSDAVIRNYTSIVRLVGLISPALVYLPLNKNRAIRYASKIDDILSGNYNGKLEEKIYKTYKEETTPITLYDISNGRDVKLNLRKGTYTLVVKDGKLIAQSSLGVDVGVVSEGLEEETGKVMGTIMVKDNGKVAIVKGEGNLTIKRGEETYNPEEYMELKPGDELEITGKQFKVLRVGEENIYTGKQIKLDNPLLNLPNNIEGETNKIEEEKEENVKGADTVEILY